MSEIFDVDQFVQMIKDWPEPTPHWWTWPLRFENRRVREAFGRHFLFLTVAGFQPERD